MYDDCTTTEKRLSFVISTAISEKKWIYDKASNFKGCIIAVGYVEIETWLFQTRRIFKEGMTGKDT